MIYNQIAQLKDLFDKEIITRDQFDKERTKLVNELNKIKGKREYRKLVKPRRKQNLKKINVIIMGSVSCRTLLLFLVKPPFNDVHVIKGIQNDKCSLQCLHQLFA